MCSIDEPNAPLPTQERSTDVDFRARLIPTEENSDNNGIGGQTTRIAALITNMYLEFSPANPLTWMLELVDLC